MPNHTIVMLSSSSMRKACVLRNVGLADGFALAMGCPSLHLCIAPETKKISKIQSLCC